MAKLPELRPAYITYHHSDGSEEQFKVTGTSWSGVDGTSMSLQARLTPLSRTHTIDYGNFTIPFTKEETVSNTYHLNDDKNAAIGAVVVAVENMEKTLLSRKLAIAETTRQQDALVAKQSNILDGKLIEALHEGVSIEDLEEHIPHHGGVLGERVEAVIDITSLDKIAELV